MKKIVLTLFVILLSNACQQAPNDDPAELRRVLTDYFDAIKTSDFQRMKDVTTADYVLFEDGRIFNNDSLINVLRSFGNFSGKFTLEILKTHVDRTSGNLYYLNKGEFVFNDTAHVTYNWIESATFRKIDDEWKIDFLHSTVRK